VPFDPEGQAWLEMLYGHETKLLQKMEEAQSSVRFLREKFQAAELLDQDGAPSETF
jgi:hypothetical protein